jgi:hypothetical protein
MPTIAPVWRRRQPVARGSLLDLAEHPDTDMCKAAEDMYSGAVHEWSTVHQNQTQALHCGGQM